MKREPRKPYRLLIIPVALAAGVGGLAIPPAAAAPGGIWVLTTTTEYDARPLGIDTQHPRLSWQLGSGTSNQSQTAYEVRVASSAAKLGAADVWNSGKIASAQSVLVPYNGPALRARTRYHWSVRVWDAAGRPSEWSAPTWWETGLLDGTGLGGQWIGHDSPLPLPTGFGGQNSPAQLKQGSTQGQSFTIDRPFSEVGISMPTWNTSDADVTIALYKEGPGGESVTRRRVENHPDNAEAKLVLDEPLPAGTYYIEQSEPAGTIGWWSHTEGDYEHGQAYADGKPVPGDRRFTLKTVSTGGPDGLTSQLRKDFQVGKKVARARLYSTALGVYNAEINGHRVGRDELAPGWTDYKTRVQYQTYDVTKLVRPGGNAVGATLAPGWYAGHIAGFGSGQYGKRPWLRAQLQIDYTDGSSDKIVTDPSWRGSTGPYVTSDLIMGEDYDARGETPGWSRPDFDATNWKPVLTNAQATVRPVAQADAATRVAKQLTPVKVTQRRPGVHIFDLGQNMVGTVKLNVEGARGKTVTLRHAEVLNKDGTLYTDNLRSAKATDTYVLKGGGPESFTPRNTFHGFRYVEVTGYPGTPSKGAITGRVMHTAEPFTMGFRTNVPMLNQLHSNITWGQRGNFLSIPTDTPARDERLGWSGDINVFSRTATYNMQSARFLTKWMGDMRDSQLPDGAFPDIAPLVMLGGGSAGWGDAGVTVPWNLYQAYGDRRVLEENYEAMGKWIAYLERNSSGLLRPASGYGDWLNINDETPKDVIGTAYFAQVTGMVAKVARTLGREEDARGYEALEGRVRDAFVRAYVTQGDTVRIKGDTQTAYVLALSMGLLPEAARKGAADRLVALIEAKDWHLSTGFLGTPQLLPVLTQTGHTDVAYRLLHQRSFPSWGYQIDQGATTMWERWDSIKPDGSFQDASMNSFNHYAYGAVGEWMYQNITGISAGEPGYKKTVIRPRPGGQVDRAAGRYDSVYGPITTRWSKSGDRFTLDVAVPVNTTAEVWIPAAGADRVSQQGARFLRMEDGHAVFETGSGSYRFTTG